MERVAITHKQLAALVWKHTHRDFRAVIDGRKSVMLPASHAKRTAFIDEMTYGELLDALPSSVLAGLTREPIQ